MLPLALVLGITQAVPCVRADTLARGTSAFRRGDCVHAFHDLSSPALRGNAAALGMLGFMYDHGCGAPQDYDRAADLYGRAAAQGNPFAQAMLGQMYDKGHGVRQNFVVAYKWLNLATARTRGEERNLYMRFRDAVASKMSTIEILEGQRLASQCATGGSDPRRTTQHHRQH